MKDKLIELGTCKKAHGIKGGFSFALYNVEDSVLEKGYKITLFPMDKTSSIDTKGIKIAISSISFGNKVTVYLDGINNRNTVEEMIPFSISIEREAFPTLSDDEFYIEDLVGIEVFDHSSGNKVGKVSSYYDNGMQTILVITGDKKIELPLIENFFPVIDLETKRIEMNLPQEV
jgi:16S rRNA processing protein RimM